MATSVEFAAQRAFEALHLAVVGFVVVTREMDHSVQ
jgi:hypothetical protein